MKFELPAESVDEKHHHGLSREECVGGMGTSFTIENEEEATNAEVNIANAEHRTAESKAAAGKSGCNTVNPVKPFIRNDSGFDSPKPPAEEANPAFADDNADNNSEDSGYEQQNNTRASKDSSKADAELSIPNQEGKTIEKNLQHRITADSKPTLLLPQISITVHDDESD